MDRARTILFPVAVGVLVLAACALSVYGYRSYSQGHDLQAFADTYGGADLAGRVAVADEYLTRYDPAVLLSVIEARYADGVCHTQAHAIGRSIYKKNANITEAVHQCGGACTYGCFHGVLMEVFTTDSDTLGGVIEDESPQAYLQKVKALARDLCTKPEVESVVRVRTCYHGLGHVFEYLRNYDLDRALTDCNIFPDRRSNFSCITGVFMEHLFAASSTALLDTHDASPCDRYPQYESECYIYKAYGWLHAWGSIDAAMTACDSFGTHRRSYIVRTAQAAATMPLLETQEGFESICGRFSGDDRDACYEGALLKVLDLNNGDDSVHACDRVTLMYYPACLEVLRVFHKNFGI